MCIRDRGTPVDTFLVGYANDVAAVILARDKELAQFKTK